MYGTITLYRGTFQSLPLTHNKLKGCSDFARRYYRNHYCFLFLRVLRCFSSPGLPPCGYYTFSIVGCPIRISADQFVCANPRSFSQLITSFIASESLGIPHTPLSSLSPSFCFAILLRTLYFKIRVFFFGGETGIAEKAHHQLNQTSPGMESCGFYDPGFVSIEGMSTENIIKHINDCEPDFIVVALGAKKGQRWIMHNRSRLNAPVISHLGAVINFVAGNVQRAPAKWQRYGFEWLWRIKQEPKLYKRYLGDGLRFIKMLVTQTLPLAVYSRRLVKKADIGNGQVFADALPQQDKFTVTFKGSIKTVQTIEFENVLQSALLSGKDVIINGAEIRYLSMSAIARLLIFQGQLEQKQNELLLKKFPARIITLLRLSSVLQRFKLI